MVSIFSKKHPNYFDAIVCYETIEHLSEYQQFISLLASGLKTGGLLFISTPNKHFSDLLTGGTANPFHVHEFYTEELEAILKKNFSKVDHFLQRPVSGAAHFWGGLAAVLWGKPQVIPATPNLAGIGDVFVPYSTSNRHTSPV